MKGYIIEDKAYLKLIMKKFQKLCYNQPDLDILFVNLTAQIGD